MPAWKERRREGKEARGQDVRQTLLQFVQRRRSLCAKVYQGRLFIVVRVHVRKRRLGRTCMYARRRPCRCRDMHSMHALQYLRARERCRSHDLEKFKPCIDHGRAQQRPDEGTNTREVFQLPPPPASPCRRAMLLLSALRARTAQRRARRACRREHLRERRCSAEAGGRFAHTLHRAVCCGGSLVLRCLRAH